MNDADLIARYDGRVPRYTSYPTAPHFKPDVGSAAYGDWLAALPEDVAVSLYVHVPFCDRLCLYCGCNTAVVRGDAPRRAYAGLLEQELRLVATRIGRRARLTHIHWGGGTPTSLPADCLVRIGATIRSLFDVAPGAEIAIEIDPTELPIDRVTALAQMGVTRASLGVQDFAPAVQRAIGRMQSYDETAQCAQSLRDIGIGSLNLDLIYGLPHQTEASVCGTARQALALGADRIAVFGYAHVPWMKRHQSLIPESALPGPLARFAQRRAISEVLEREGGFMVVGLDHYARPGDAMALSAEAGTLQRSFQGYTTDAAPVLIGIGASAIGTMPQGYVQNAPGVPAYAAAIKSGSLATIRGIATTEGDRLRRSVIERIMCDLQADIPANLRTSALEPFAADGLIRWDGKRVVVTEAGRPFVRNVAAVFDAYLTQGNATPRHAQAV